MEKLNEDTIDEIQFTAPDAYERQARHLYAKVDGGQIFSAFSDAKRNGIWLRLCSATKDCLVPSLLAFFANLKYLQPAADYMRRLVHLERKQSIRCAFKNAFYPGEGDACFMQTSSASFTTIPISAADSFDITYRQVWLYALREQREMPIKLMDVLATARPMSGQSLTDKDDIDSVKGKYARTCWNLEPLTAGAWANPSVGQHELYIPEYFRIHKNMIFVGEHTSYTHGWIAPALDSGNRGAVQLMLDLGLVDDAKAAVKKWLVR